MFARAKHSAIAAGVTLVLVTGVVVAAPAVATQSGETLAACIADTMTENPGTPEGEISDLDCTGYTDITSLDGIQQLGGLTSLTIHGAPGADGDITPLNSLGLASLDLESFNITDVSKLTALNGAYLVDLAHNHLSSLPMFDPEGLETLDVSYNDFTDPSTILQNAGAGSSYLYVEGNHLTNLSPLGTCVVFDASGQTVSLAATQTGLATSVPAVINNDGIAVDVAVAAGSAASGAISGGKVTWATTGTGTLSWDTSINSSPCGGSGEFSGTMTQTVTQGAPQSPTITSISPSAGPITGGTTVTITGSGFTGASSVAFGGTSAASFTVESDTSIKAVTPSHPAGTVQITVSNGGGTSSNQTDFAFRSPAAPRVSGVHPAHGPQSGGSQVQVFGLHFAGAMSVTIGGVPVPFTVNGGKPDIITFTTPGSTTTGPVPVVITTPSGSVTTTFTFDAVPAPRVSGVHPAHGPQSGGSQVQVFGLHFAGAMSVTIGGVPVPFTVNGGKPDIITFTTPGSTTTGPVPVVITTPSGSVTTTFTFDAVPAPRVSGVHPAHGPQSGGSQVQVFGLHFAGAMSVTIGGVPVPFTVNGGKPDIITFTTPGSTTTGPVPVVITTPSGSVTTTFTFDAVPAPRVSGVHPAHGPQSGGSQVQVFGLHFAGAMSVTIGGVPVPFTVNGGKPDIITFTTPGSTTTGPVPVVITTPSGSVTTTFTFDAVPAPRVSGVHPAHGPQSGGSQVQVFGLHFAGAMSVTIGGVPVPFTVNGGKPDIITFTTPGSTTTGPVPVVITTPSGSVTTTFTFD